VRSRGSSFRWEHPLLSLRSSSRFLRILPRLPVTYIPPFTFPSISCFGRQLLRKMWPILLAFRLRISCTIFLCTLTLISTTSFLTWSVQMIFSPAFSSTTFQNFLGVSDLLPEASKFQHHKSYAPNVACYYLDGLVGWTEPLVVSFVRRPTNAEGSGGFFIINTLQTNKR
jgi:hypothetical protein